MTYAEAVPADDRLRQMNVIEHPAALGSVPGRSAIPWGGVLAFLAFVALPAAVAAWYLFWIAGDRYASRTAFSIRSNEVTAPVEIFGAVTQLGGSSAVTDGRILNEFIGSQPMLERARGALALDEMWNRQADDWLFALGRDQPVEDALWHWQRMVDVHLDTASGIVTVEARAFTPDDARAIAREILLASGEMVNRLSEDARSDAVRHAAEQLNAAEARLRAVRAKLRAFRDLEQEVDPAMNAQAALGLVAALEEEQARAQVRLESLGTVLDADAPRLRGLKREIETLEKRIAQERTRLGTGTQPETGDARPLSQVVGDFEELVVDREFAEQAYTLALSTYEQAQADARRQSRYLAVHIPPTLSEDAEYPNRPTLLTAVFALFLAGWAILSLIAANIRERR